MDHKEKMDNTRITSTLVLDHRGRPATIEPAPAQSVFNPRELEAMRLKARGIAEFALDPVSERRELVNCAITLWNLTRNPGEEPAEDLMFRRGRKPRLSTRAKEARGIEWRPSVLWKRRSHAGA